MDEQLERIEREGALVLTSENDRHMFRFYLRRMWSQRKSLDQLLTTDGRLVAAGFLEMME